MSQSYYTTQTCCKINLGLNIVERRPDGYHNLQTIFYPVPLCDELSIRRGENEDVLTLCGNPLEGEVQDNLVLRAVRLLRQEGFMVPPLHIDLRKVIPSGAGLGGGVVMPPVRSRHFPIFITSLFQKNK